MTGRTGGSWGGAGLWPGPSPSILGPLGGVLQALLLGSLAGSLVGLVVVIVKRRWRQAFPFGPMLALGGLVAILLAAPGPV